MSNVMWRTGVLAAALAGVVVLELQVRADDKPPDKLTLRSGYSEKVLVDGARRVGLSLTLDGKGGGSGTLTLDPNIRYEDGRSTAIAIHHVPVRAKLVRDEEHAAKGRRVYKLRKEGLEGSVEEKGQHWLLVKPLKEGLPCWLLFADKDGKVQDVLMLEHEPPAKEKPKGLTIDEAVKAKPGGTVTVVFEVTAARSGVSPGISLKEHRFVIIEPKGVLKDGGTFRVCISGPAVVPLFTLGLVDERVDGGDSFFKGKTVRVTGILDSRESAVKAGTNDYRLSVFDPGRTHYRSYDVP